MRIEYDDAKNQSNIAKHGVGFEEAAQVFGDPDSFDRADDRQDYGEERRIRLGAIGIGGRVFVVAYTVRNASIRIISARKANEREQRTYHHRQPSHTSE